MHTILSGFVELTQPATTRDLHTLLSFAKSEAATTSINSLLSSYQDAVLSKRVSVLDILEAHSPNGKDGEGGERKREGLAVPFQTFLSLLPPMRVRQYSISSSPLVNPTRCSLTVSVLSTPSSSNDKRMHLGVASTYLASLSPGDLLPLSVRPSGAAFHLPPDPRVPVVMFAAGSGLAPFRGFVQERAAQKEAGREVGRMMLFFGCREPGVDYLYAREDEEELRKWMESGVVDVRPAFSRMSESSEGCKYVQE